MINNIITQQNAVDELYRRGKACITAHKEAAIDKKYRPYLALFADGTFLVDERARDDAVLQNLVLEFYKDYPLQRMISKQYVSAQMLKAVYHRAQNFDWYRPQYDIPADLGAADRQRLQGFLERVLRRRCLSITTLTTPEWFRFYSPDKEKFALFEGGWLVVAQNSPHIETLSSNISRFYPQVEMVEVVPQYYVEAIYEKLLYIEPSAREIYINLVRQKLEKFWRLTSEEALQVMQNQKHDWKKLLLLDEKTARSMIYSDFAEKALAATDEAWAQVMANKKEYHIGTFL